MNCRVPPELLDSAHFEFLSLRYLLKDIHLICWATNGESGGSFVKHLFFFRGSDAFLKDL